jgi:hypothetical protein
MSVKLGAKLIEFENGNAGIAVPSREKLARDGHPDRGLETSSASQRGTPGTIPVRQILTGTAVLVAACAASLLVIERLFRVLKPEIMMIGWFNRLWTVLVASQLF